MKIIYIIIEQHAVIEVFAVTSAELYCLVTEASRCEQLAQGCYTATHRENRIHDLTISSPTLYRFAIYISRISDVLYLCVSELLFVVL